MNAYFIKYYTFTEQSISLFEVTPFPNWNANLHIYISIQNKFKKKLAGL